MRTNTARSIIEVLVWLSVSRIIRSTSQGGVPWNPQTPLGSATACFRDIGSEKFMESLGQISLGNVSRIIVDRDLFYRFIGVEEGRAFQSRRQLKYILQDELVVVDGIFILKWVAEWV